MPIRSVARKFLEHWLPNVSRTYRQVRDQRIASSYVSEVTPFGFLLAGPAPMATGKFEAEEIAIFITHLQRSDVCIDIGANIGLYSCLAKKHGKRVVAIEPLITNLEVLYRNLVCNEYLDVEVFPVGLSCRSGIERLFGGSTGASFLPGWAGVSETWHRIVPVTTLDAVVGHRFQNLQLLIKMDVEGFESEVLKGGGQTLAATPKPTWLVEISLDEHFPDGLNPNFRQIFETFWRHGYEARIANSEQRTVQQHEVNRWLEQGRSDFGSHNYLFLTPGSPRVNVERSIVRNEPSHDSNTDIQSSGKTT